MQPILTLLLVLVQLPFNQTNTRAITHTRIATRTTTTCIHTTTRTFCGIQQIF